MQQQRVNDELFTSSERSNEWCTESSVLGVDAIVALIATTHEDLRALSLVPRFVSMDGRCLEQRHCFPFC
jgi:hypothetical protein